MNQASIRVGVIIPAAGKGRRFGGPVPKQYQSVAGKPIIVHTLSTVLAVPDVHTVVIALAEHDEFGRNLISAEFSHSPLVHLTVGGEERSASVVAALRHDTFDNVDVVLVHDAVRPLASPLLFRRVIAAAASLGAVVPGMPLSDTIKVVDEHGVVISTPNRSQLRAVQTPQGFRRELLVQAYANASTATTDDGGAVEAIGVPIVVIEGEPWNIKITTAVDLDVAEALYRWRQHATK